MACLIILLLSSSFIEKVLFFMEIRLTVFSGSFPLLLQVKRHFHISGHQDVTQSPSRDVVVRYFTFQSLINF